MTFTYTLNPAGIVLDRVRFLIQDNIQESHLIEDEEIDYVLDKLSGGVDSALNTNKVLYGACALLCDTIAARYARTAEVRVSNYATDKTAIFDKYKQLAQEFRAKSITKAAFVMPSISVTTKDTHFTDDDIPQPSFKRGLFEHPEASTETDDTELSTDY